MRRHEGSYLKGRHEGRTLLVGGAGAHVNEEEAGLAAVGSGEVFGARRNDPVILGVAGQDECRGEVARVEGLLIRKTEHDAAREAVNVAGRIAVRGCPDLAAEVGSARGSVRTLHAVLGDEEARGEARPGRGRVVVGAVGDVLGIEVGREAVRGVGLHVGYADVLDLLVLRGRLPGQLPGEDRLDLVGALSLARDEKDIARPVGESDMLRVAEGRGSPGSI